MIQYYNDGILKVNIKEGKNIKHVLAENYERLFGKRLYSSDGIDEGQGTRIRWKIRRVLDKIEKAVEAASSFEGIGDELKRKWIDYEYSTKMLPIYIIEFEADYKSGLEQLIIIDKNCVTDAERIVGDVAIGSLR